MPQRLRGYFSFPSVLNNMLGNGCTDLENSWKHRKKKDGGDYMVVVVVSLLSYVWM